LLEEHESPHRICSKYPFDRLSLSRPIEEKELGFVAESFAVMADNDADFPVAVGIVSRLARNQSAVAIASGLKQERMRSPEALGASLWQRLCRYGYSNG